MSDHLFVYGTLKRGHCRAVALAGQQFLGEAVTEAGFRLVDCGSYPGLIRQSPGLSIRGEVYSIAPRLWAKLDRIEGTDLGLYRRITVPLQPPFDGLVVQSYEFLGDSSSLRNCGDFWP